MKKGFLGRLIDNLTGKSLQSSKQVQKPASQKIPQSVPQSVSPQTSTTKAPLQRPATLQKQSPTPHNQILNRRSVPSNKRSVSSLLRTLFITVVLVFMGGAIAYLTELDTQVLSVSLQGTIYDDLAAPLPNAQVEIQGKTVQTNQQGEYRVTSLKLGTSDIRITAEGYTSVVDQIAINRALFDYTNIYNATLQSTAYGTVEGVFTSNSESISFDNETIQIGGEIYPINDDGSFRARFIPVGEQTFTFASPSYQDITAQITIQPGQNIVELPSLEPAADITGVLKAYITEQPVSRVTISGTRILPESIRVDEEKNTFRIIDVVPNETYDIRIEAPGLRTRDYMITPNQGENQLFDISFVPQQQAVYRATFNDTDSIISSDLDGKDASFLFSIGDVEPQQLYFNTETNQVFFLSSQIDRATSRNRTPRAYIYNLENNEVTQLTTQEQEADRTIASFTSETLVLGATTGRNDPQTTVRLHNLDGTQKAVLLEAFSGRLIAALVSDNQQTAALLMEDNDTRRLVRVAVQTGESLVIAEDPSLQLYDIDSQGNRILFSTDVSSGTTRILQMYVVPNAETRRLIADAQGSQYQFLRGSDEQVIFHDTDNGRDGIYIFTLSRTSTRELFTLSARDEIISLYQQGDYVFYQTEDTLYVVDIDFPHAYKQVR